MDEEPGSITCPQVSSAQLSNNETCCIKAAVLQKHGITHNVTLDKNFIESKCKVTPFSSVCSAASDLQLHEPPLSVICSFISFMTHLAHWHLQLHFLSVEGLRALLQWTHIKSFLWYRKGQAKFLRTLLCCQVKLSGLFRPVSSWHKEQV
eukprot:2256027-Amphidinium_carterae.1